MLVVQVTVYISNITLLFLMLPPCVSFYIDGLLYMVTVYRTVSNLANALTNTP